MALIEVIDYDEAEGELLKIYDGLISSRGKLADVHKIQSLNPPTIVAHMDLYMKIMFGKSPLRRYQREMIAVIASVNNKCEYCIKHHAEALLHFWKDQEKVDRLAQNYLKADLQTKDKLLCKLAERLTTNPNYPDKAILFDALRAEGLTDRAILDATLVIAYFNFVNRIVLNLGVDLEADGGTGYEYE